MSDDGDDEGEFAGLRQTHSGFMREGLGFADDAEKGAEGGVFGGHHKQSEQQGGQEKGASEREVDASPENEEEKDEKEVAEGAQAFGKEVGERAAGEGNPGNEGTDFVGEADVFGDNGDPEAPAEGE